MTAPSKPIKIMLVDDQSLIRQGLRVLLNLETDLEVVAEAEQGQAALDLLDPMAAAESLPDVVLMDLRMPVMDGIAATQRIRDRYPSVQVLVLTTFDEQALVAEAVEMGALGYVLKDTPVQDLAVMIRSIHKGYGQFGPGILSKLAAPKSSQSPTFSSPTTTNPFNLSNPEPGMDLLQTLTARERQVLYWIAQGSSNREIAQKLYLSEGTVKNHITRILSCLQVRDRTQAALLVQSLPYSWFFT